MDYDHTENFPGDSSAGLKNIAETFTQLGFRIVHRDGQSVRMTGPGMNNTRQSPLVGVSALTLEARPGSLRLEADFGSLDRLMKFMGIFIAAMALFFLVLFGFLFRGRPNFSLWTVVLPFLPWPVLYPIIRSVLRRRLARALDNLLHNAAMMA